MSHYPDESEFYAESPYDQDSPIYSHDPAEEELAIEYWGAIDYEREKWAGMADGLDDGDYEYEEQPPILRGPAFDVWHCWVNDRGADIIPF